MRVSIVSIALAGGILTLGACAPVDSGPMTLAERTEHCERLGTSLAPTGRETGDARQDYRCRNIQATAYGHGSREARQASVARDKVLRAGG